MKLLLLIFFLVSSLLYAKKPELFLLKNYKDDINVTNWYMSEKLDGVRAYWNGKKLISRSGKVFNVPKFFIKDFPPFKLDGELWTKRGDFSNIVSIVNKKKPHHGWKVLTYNIFEVPSAKGTLTQRLQTIKNYLKTNPNKYIRAIKQIKVKSNNHLKEFQIVIENKGGEGLVVRNSSLAYYTGRDKNSLKVKSFIDDECTIVGYSKGKGKYDGQIGSLSCRMKNNQVIKIGSGLSDNQRQFPPKIDDIITFKYYGLTAKGNPRFPIFMRVSKNK